jgi:hypothetical protein
MAHENPTWGEERIAAELLLKLGIRVSRPGIPDPGEAFATTRNRHMHQLAHDCKVVGRSVLGGLHHEHRLERIAA